MSYPGGKNSGGAYQLIISNMPPHRVYVEAFAGGAAVLRHKRPAERSIALDLSAAVVNQARTWNIPGLEVYQADALAWLASAKPGPDWLVYIDPPYPKSACRSKKRMYPHEMTDKQHAQLLEIVTALPCYVVVSGYDCPMYTRALAGWRLVTFQMMTRGGRMATEHLWMNYTKPRQLHDPRWVGRGFRDRERRRRKEQRHVDDLQDMDLGEAQSLVETLNAAYAEMIGPIACQLISSQKTMGARIAGRNEASCGASTGAPMVAAARACHATDSESAGGLATADDGRASPGAASAASTGEVQSPLPMTMTAAIATGGESAGWDIATNDGGTR